MKFTTLFVLTLGATLTGVLAAPILNGGNMAIANMVSITQHPPPPLLALMLRSW